MATQTNKALKVVNVSASRNDSEVLADSLASPDAIYLAKGYIARDGEKLLESLDSKGDYPDMSVGTASDLSGHLEATSAQFVFRASAGEKSIRNSSAQIKRIKGNSVVFNELCYPHSNNGITNTLVNGTMLLQGTTTATYINTSSAASLVAGEKVYLAVVIKNPNKVRFNFGDLNNPGARISINSNFVASAIIYTVSVTRNHSLGFESLSVGADLSGVEITQSWINLTRMYGAGNEPTIEEHQALYPNSYYPYTPVGVIQDLNLSGIETIGLNQFDKDTVTAGTISASGAIDSSIVYSTQNIEVLPNTDYYLKDVCNGYNFPTCAFYDAQRNFISSSNIRVTINPPTAVSGTVTTPLNAKYMVVCCHNDYLSACCVSIVHSGYNNGIYEPYIKETKALPISAITGGEPLRSCGSVYDEINEKYYIKRVGVVDMGTLNWVAEGNNIFVVYQMPNMIVTTTDNSRLDGLFCAKYATDSIPDVGPAMADKTMKRHQGRLYLRDTSFTDSSSFKTSLSGVILNYELAESIVSPIDTPIDFSYYVEDFGTEKALFSADSAPLRADIVYAFNATDNIRDNERNIQRLNKKVSELATAKNIGTKPLRFLALNEAVEPFTFTVFESEFTLSDDSNDPDASTIIMLTPPDSNIGIDEITHIVEYEFTFTTGGEVNSYLHIAGANWGEISNEIEPNMRYIIKVITFDGVDYLITEKRVYTIN